MLRLQSQPITRNTTYSLLFERIWDFLKESHYAEREKSFSKMKGLYILGLEPPQGERIPLVMGHMHTGLSYVERFRNTFEQAPKPNQRMANTMFSNYDSRYLLNAFRNASANTGRLCEDGRSAGLAGQIPEATTVDLNDESKQTEKIDSCFVAPSIDQETMSVEDPRYAIDHLLEDDIHHSLETLHKALRKQFRDCKNGHLLNLKLDGFFHERNDSSNSCFDLFISAQHYCHPPTWVRMKAAFIRYVHSFTVRWNVFGSSLLYAMRPRSNTIKETCGIGALLTSA